MVQIDLKKLREMQEGSKEPKPDNLENIDTPSLESVSATDAGILVENDTQAVSPLEVVSPLEGEIVSQKNEVNAPLNLPLSRLHESSGESSEQISYKQREDELNTVFGEMQEGKGEEKMPDSIPKMPEMSEKIDTEKEMTGFFPHLSLIPETTEETSKSESLTDAPLGDMGATEIVKEPSEEQVESPSEENITNDNHNEEAPKPDEIDLIAASIIPETTDESIHPSHKKSLIWAASGLGVILVATAGGIFAYNNSQKSPNTIAREGTPQIQTLNTIGSTPQDISGSTNTGETHTGTTLSGSQVQSGTTNSLSGGTQSTLSGSGVLTKGSQSGAVTTTGATLAKTQTPSISTGTIAKPPLSTSGSLSVAPAKNATGAMQPSTESTNSGKLQASGTTLSGNQILEKKLIEGRDYKVYGGGFKLVKSGDAKK